MPDVSVVTVWGRLSGFFDGSIPGEGTLFLPYGRYAGEFDGEGKGAFKVLGPVSLTAESALEHNNIISNPSFEGGSATGWSSLGSGTTLTPVDTDSRFGEWSLEVESDAAGSKSAGFAVAGAPDTGIYTGGIWVRGFGNSVGLDFELILNSAGQGNFAISDLLVLMDFWQFVEASGELDPAGTNLILIANFTASNVGQAIRIDGASLRLS